MRLHEGGVVNDADELQLGAAGEVAADAVVQALRGSVEAISSHSAQVDLRQTQEIAAGICAVENLVVVLPCPVELTELQRIAVCSGGSGGIPGTMP